MAYTLKQAAETTGKTKTTILRAIKSGKLSATRHEITNSWLIEPSELHRLYPQRSASETRSDADHNYASKERTVEIELLREMLAERDRRVADKDTVIDELRRQLSAADEERRTTLRQLTALLTDQRAKPASEAIPMPPPASPAEAEDHPDRQSPRHVSPAPASGIGWWRRMVGGK
jgi:excisionase family DNA binding protein